MSIQSVPAWKQIQAWHDNQSAVTRKTFGSPFGGQSDFTYSFGDAAANYYSGAAKLAAQAALKRIQAATNAATAAATTSSVNKIA